MRTLQEALAASAEAEGVDPSAVTELNLDGRCKANSVQGLQDFASLITLSLGSVSLGSLAGFPALPQLHTLSMPDNKIAGGLEHLSGCSALSKLDLSGNKLATMEELQALTELPNLRSLDLVACPVEAVPDFRKKVFGMLPGLKYLNNEDVDGEEADDGEDEDDDEEAEAEAEDAESEEHEEEDVEDNEGEEGEGEEEEEYEEAAGDEEEGDEEDDDEEDGGEEFDDEEDEEGDEEDEEGDEEDDPPTAALYGEVEDDEEDFDVEAAQGVKRKRGGEEEEEEEEGDDEE